MKKTFFLFTFLVSHCLFGQANQTSSADIFQDIKKLKVLGSVLYLAAHPDDENTLMLSYLAQDQLYRTGYLSLTRGDGGQNLIGAEQGYNIGVIRTQELLAARKIDGAEQFFSRAYDFGYSKTQTETLNFWDQKKVLGDVVWMIRKFQPDVIITRFPPDSRAGHGHHQTSAYLAEEGFKLANNPNAYPEQLKFVKPWQAKRIVWNTYSPGFTNNPPQGDPKLSYIPVEIGGYNAILGKSYNEIAAESRSQHKSQGFGSAVSRGKRTDYLIHKDGVAAKKALFDDIDPTWRRVAGENQIEPLVTSLIENFQISNPSASIPALLHIHSELNKLDSTNHYIQLKKTEIQNLIVQCLGLWFETNPREYASVAGEKININISVINRSDVPLKLISYRWTGAKQDSVVNLRLENNLLNQFSIQTILPTDLKLSQPYWLLKPVDKGNFQIDQQEDIGYPENRPETKTTYVFEIDGQRFSYTKDWQYKFTNPAEGEIYRDFEIRPAVTTNITEPVFVFSDNKPKSIQVRVESHQAQVNGIVRLVLPKNWKSSPASIPFDLKEKNQEQVFTFTITPSNTSEEIIVKSEAIVNNKTYTHSIKSIAYHHIPTQTIFPLSEAKLVRTNVTTTAKKIGYIAGAGDDIPTALRQIGCEVTMLNEAELAKNLQVYDAIVVGVRAYNTEARLVHEQKKLMAYVENGGTMVVQYVIPGNMQVAEIGPYPLKTGRDRISEEDAKLDLLLPNHALLNFPNKITAKDFDGWIQERGLYFAQEWDSTHYDALLVGHDTGEAPLKGSLLYAKYGKGHYIYTGLSFFRELPAGVSGAYRLFANLISAGKK
jgi:LmbE family N-acetylglucosaminyl deacetylase